MSKLKISVLGSIYLVLTSLNVLAADVKITSFRFLESGATASPAAELCGELVTPSNKPEMLKIISDPKSKAPGLYYIWAGKDGKFCCVLATYSGNAEAELVQ